MRKSRHPSEREHLPVLGVDVGGVLVDLVADGLDTSFFGERPMETPAVAGAFEGVAALARDHFEYRVHIVSKAGPKISELTREWLGSTGFFAQTGASAANLHFVRKRHEKAPVCERLGVTHFIDDRAEVLAHLTTVPNRFLFLGGLGPRSRPQRLDDSLIVVESWSDVLDCFAGSV